MYRKTKKIIEDLIQHNNQQFPNLHNQTLLTEKNVFSLSLALQNKISYKAYSRFPEIKLKKTNIYSKILNIAADFIEEDRIKRQFEIYLYNNDTATFPLGLYHFYIKNRSLEKLPSINLHHINDMLVKPVDKNIKSVLLITISIGSLPQTNRNWWYRSNILEVGKLTERIMTAADKIQYVCEDFIDEEANKMLNINTYNESTIQVMTTISHS